MRDSSGFIRSGRGCQSFLRLPTCSEAQFESTWTRSKSAPRKSFGTSSESRASSRQSKKYFFLFISVVWSAGNQDWKRVRGLLHGSKAAFVLSQSVDSSKQVPDSRRGDSERRHANRQSHSIMHSYWVQRHNCDHNCTSTQYSSWLWQNYRYESRESGWRRRAFLITWEERPICWNGESYRKKCKFNP